MHKFPKCLTRSSRDKKGYKAMSGGSNFDAKLSKMAEFLDYNYVSHRLATLSLNTTTREP